MNAKYRSGLYLPLAALVMALTAGAALADGRAEDHAALRALKEKAVAAINQQDVDSLLECFAETFVFTAIDQHVVTNRQAIAEYYARMLQSKEAPIDKLQIVAEADDLTRFLGETAGVCVGKSKETYTLKDGKIFNMEARWTAMVVKEGSDWKIAAVHVGVNVLDNPILETLSMGFWKKVGVALRLVDPPYDKAK